MMALPERRLRSSGSDQLSPGCIAGAFFSLQVVSDQALRRAGIHAAGLGYAPH